MVVPRVGAWLYRCHRKGFCLSAKSIQFFENVQDLIEKLIFIFLQNISFLEISKGTMFSDR